MFQGWVPEQYLAGKFVWLAHNIEWEKFKQTDHTKIKSGEYNIIRGVYLGSIIGTIDDRSFFTPEGLKKVDAWQEEMVVGYSDIKCAGLNITLVEKYINQDKLNPEFKVHKERWIKELNRIAAE